jgi:hypothetical protein
MNNRIYYHFLSSRNAIHDLERKMIRVSLIDTLNDPFELMPNLSYRDTSKRKRIKSIRKAFAEKYGLLCFSGNWAEPLLWGHYADKHKGVALGFEILKDRIIEVEYSDSPLRVQIELSEDSENNEDVFFGLAKTKYHKWKYENEYRILVALRDCIEIDNHHFLPFHERLRVKEIILGCYYDNNREYIVWLAKQFKANIIATRMEWKGYKINRCGTRTNRLRRMSALIEVGENQIPGTPN